MIGNAMKAVQGLVVACCTLFSLGASAMARTQTVSRGSTSRDVQMWWAKESVARSWEGKLRVLRLALQASQIDGLSRALEIHLTPSTNPMEAASLTRCYVLWAFMSHYGLVHSNPPNSMHVAILRYMKKPVAASSPRCLYARYLLLSLPQPPEGSDHYKMITVGIEHPDGTKGTVTMPFYDGDEAATRKNKMTAALVEQAKKLDPEDPELAYMIARQAPHSRARCLKLVDLVSKHPKVLFGFPPAYTVYKAAEELGMREGAEKWMARAKTEWRGLDPLSRSLYLRDDHLDPRVWIDGAAGG